MGKAIISNRIYLDSLDGDSIKKIREELTYKIVVESAGKGRAKPIITIKNYKNLTRGIISIPQMRMDLIPKDYEIVDKRLLVPVTFPVPKLDLYDNQKVIYDQVTDSCIVNALVGWGKTFTAIYLAAKLGQRTLIITHTLAIRDNWISEIRLLLGIEPGVIGSGKMNYKNKVITVANTQTLKKHVKEVEKEFGTIIVDECHRTPASTFSDIVNGMYARYRIGLSGTLTRKDKKHVVLQDYFGTEIYKPPEANTMEPKILLVDSGIALNSNLPWADRITELVRNKKYLSLISSIAAIQMAKGHKVLIISDRVEFLVSMGEMLGDSIAVVTGEIGDRDEAKRQLIAEEICGIAGSRGIYAEGTNVPIISCLILALPINNDPLLEQIVGRVQRTYKDKLQPVVIDVQFCGWADKKQNNSRLEFYLRKQWEVSAL